MRLPYRHRLLAYGWLPLISACMWLATLLGLMGLWAQDGTPRYEADSPGIQYISDVGAQYKRFFIGGAVVTSVFFVAALGAERYLRHQARLRPDLRRRERYLSLLAILFSAGGGACLIGLSVRDARNHGTEHWRFTIGFIVCIALSAVFTTAEIGWLRTDHPASRLLRFSYIAKIVIVCVAIAFAIVFGVLYKYNKGNPAAVFEWIIAFIFDFYLWTIVYDLRPSIKRRTFISVDNSDGAKTFVREGSIASEARFAYEDRAQAPVQAPQMV